MSGGGVTLPAVSKAELRARIALQRRRVQRARRLEEDAVKQRLGHATAQRRRENRRKLEDTLADLREALAAKDWTTVQRLCDQVLRHPNTRCENFRTSDGRTAGDDLRQMRDEGRVWNEQTESYVKLHPGPLRATLRMARDGEVRLNALSNGTHSPPSAPFPSGTHPRGKGGDWDYGSAVSDQRMAECVREEGGYALFEQGHLHGSWR